MPQPKGFLIGKFMPLHKGHLHMIREAQRQVDHLTIMIFWKENEPISGPQRVQWLHTIFPDITILECTDTHPIDYQDPDIWDLWMASIRKSYHEQPDLVFGSEEYIETLARRLGAQHQYIDSARIELPISARWIRTQPWMFWRYIPEEIQPYFVQKICILGGESTGKTTLVRQLAQHFESVWIEEYAREFLNEHDLQLAYADMLHIATTQRAREQEAQKTANRFLFCDTNAIATKIWSNYYFGSTDPQIIEWADEACAFYLLLAPDIPWVDDGMRDSPQQRDLFFQAFQKELETQQRSYAVITGTGSHRFVTACQTIYNHFYGSSQQSTT